MIYRHPREDEWEKYETLAKHPLQAKAWGDFRENTGVEVVRLVGFEGEKMFKQMQLTLHPIPKFRQYKVGYLPKGEMPDKFQLQVLRELGQKKKAIFIKLEPDVSSPPLDQEEIEEKRKFLLENGCRTGRSLFTPYSFILDLGPSENELLKQMKSKTRYNIGLAQRKGVEVEEDSTEKGFEDYLNLLKITTKRQQFFAHGEDYQKKMWDHIGGAGIAKILKAKYQGKVIAAWVLFVYKDKLYYPYGASSREHNEVMASNLLMWEAIRFGKLNKCKWFDMWGSLGPEPDRKDPWYGFHKFKEGYGGDLANFVGSYDLVIDQRKYDWYRKADRLRWKLLRLKAKLPFIG